MKMLHYKICFPGSFNGKSLQKVVLLYYPDSWQKIGTKFIKLLLLKPELCFFMQFKLYSEHLANAHAQIKKIEAYQKLLYCDAIKLQRSPFESEYKLRN